jgi:hypothetical protein
MKIIGIDGGATKVSGAQVIRIDDQTFELIKPIKEIQYKDHKSYDSNFAPFTLEEQLANKELTSTEQNQSQLYIECITEIIEQIIEEDPIPIAIAMPGIKTANKRGIKAMVNGPRIPNLCDELEKRLSLKYKIQSIESDADMCAWGEEFGKTGAFRNIENAYYIGGGTGTADGLKLQGKLISFDDAAKWIAKVWELVIEKDTSFESFSSMSGINQLRTSRSDKEIGLMLGNLLFERISTVFSGWNNQFMTDRNIENMHPYHGTLLDRIVIGQRVSDFLQSDQGAIIFSEVIETLFINCMNSETEIKNHFINNEGFDKDRIVLSNLRSAPIIGLAAKSCLVPC